MDTPDVILQDNLLISKTEGTVTVSLHEQSSFHRNLGEFEIIVKNGKLDSIVNKSPSYSKATRFGNVVSCTGKKDSYDWKFEIELDIKESVEGFPFCILLAELKHGEAPSPGPLTSGEAALDGHPSDEIYIHVLEVDPANPKKPLHLKPRVPNHDDYFELNIDRNTEPDTSKFKDKSGTIHSHPPLVGGFLTKPGSGLPNERSFRIAFLEQDGNIGQVFLLPDDDDHIGTVLVKLSLVERNGKYFLAFVWTAEKDATVTGSKTPSLQMEGCGSKYVGKLYIGKSQPAGCD